MAKKTKRIPVTKDSYRKSGSAKTRPSMTTDTMGQGQIAKTAKAKTGKVDKNKIKYATSGIPGMRQASGVGDVWHTSGQSYNSSYRSSYANNGNSAGAFGDVPLYFALMNENNGGILYWPVNLKEKYSWYRYFYRCIYLNDNKLGMILMSDGTQKDIREVKVGEEIVTAKGTIKKVKEIFNRRAIGKAVTVKAHCLQNPIKTTHHHPFYVLRNNNVDVKGGNGKKKKLDEIIFAPEWLKADELKVGDYVLQPSLKNKISNITIDEARLLGYYCAEGHIIWGSRCVGTDMNGKGYKWKQEKIKVPVGVGFTINTNEKETLGKAILGYAKKAFGVDGQIVRERNNGLEINISGREIAEYCHYHVGCGSSTKKLSEELVSASVEAKKNFLIAYAGGDGCQYDGKSTNKGKLVIGTSSPYLASQVQFMSIGCGIMCRFAEYKRTKNSGFNSENPKTKQYHITIPSSASQCLYEISDKWEKTTGVKKFRGGLVVDDYVAFKIKEIEYTEEDDEVWNLAIDADADENSFICNGMAVHNTDPFVGQAIDLHIELPLSKFMLKMPEMKDKKRRERIEKKYQKMISDLKLFEKLQSILFEFLLIGNCYIFMEYDEKEKSWKKMIILPPEEVNVYRYPFSDHSRVEYNPEMFMEIVKKIQDKGSYKKLKNHKQLTNFLEEDEMKAIEHIPVELINHIIEHEAIVMDTDPYTGDKDIVGSYVYHMARRKSEYEDLGVSILERCLTPLLMKEHYKYTQLSLASRNMTPRNKISAPGITPEDLDDLREQIDLSMLDPDYSIVTNYDWSWEQIGADQRLIDLQREYETIENQMFAGLGVTRELLTGEGQYSGGRITVEIMNTRYMLMREVLKNMIEENIFKPIAEVNEFYDIDKDGYKTYYYPSMSFNRLTIRDNAEVFDSLFQLYQKGSLPIDTILDLFNIDSHEVHEKLVEDQFTVKDAVYNDMMRSVYGDIATAVVEKSDITKKMIETLSGPDGKNLTYQDPEAEGTEGGDEDWGGDDEFSMDDSEIDEMAESTADAIDEAMPDDATEEDIDNALSELKGDDEEETDSDDEEVDSEEETDSDEEENSEDVLESLADDITIGLEKSLPEDATKDDIDNALEKLKTRVDDDSNDKEVDVFVDELVDDLEKSIPEGATDEDIEEAIDNLKK